MEQQVPKKRGRKKKNPEAEVPQSRVANSEVSTAAENTEHRGMGKLPKELGRVTSKRTIKLYKLLGAVKHYDGHVESAQFIKDLQSKFMNLRYHNYMWRSEGYDLQYSKLYKELKNGKISETSEMTWNKSVTRNAVKKISSVIEHLLMGGPLTTNETYLLNQFIHLLKLYYRDRYFLCIN